MIKKLPNNKKILFSADGAECLLEESLRELPGKRLVCKGMWKQQLVVAKLFLDPRKAQRHWAREKRGIEALQNAKIPTPELLYAGATSDETPVLISSYLPDVDTVFAIWENRKVPELKAGMMGQLAEMVGRLHEAGLLQKDLHLGNFLVSEHKIYAIDGDAVCTRDAGKPLGLKASSRNLALLFAQLPPSDDSLLEEASVHYGEQRNMPHQLLLDQLKQDLPSVRRRRRHKYVKKCSRTCSEFVRSKRFDQVAVFRRDAQGDALTRLLDDPDTFMQRGEFLKDGITTTIVRIQEDGIDWVVKRYNIKGLGHAFQRYFRPTRAWTSWRNSHRLKISGIATPRAVAMIEKRIGSLRSTGYYVCDFVDAPNTKQIFLSPEVPVAEKELLAEKYVQLFGLFRKLRIHHGDCKAHNFLFKDSLLWILDLDAMQERSTAVGFEKLFRIDRRRFLRNWETQPELHQWFDEHLPENGWQ